jgi:two-component system sensor histidine kinase PilS (NtrC family)
MVENAIQAMPGGGQLAISAVAGEGDVTLTLRDTGVGMDAAAVARAFEPYFSTKTGGSGLGLANAKRYLELQGGHVAIDSTPGQGTELAVRLRSEAARLDASAAGRAPAR